MACRKQLWYWIVHMGGPATRGLPGSWELLAPLCLRSPTGNFHHPGEHQATDHSVSDDHQREDGVEDIGVVDYGGAQENGPDRHEGR